MRPLLCSFCGKRLAAKNGWLEIYDEEVGPPFRSARCLPRFTQDGGRDIGGALAYPGKGAGAVDRGEWNGASTVVLFAHTACGPDIGYAIELTRISAKDDWDCHLREKVWWTPVIRRPPNG